MNRLGQPRSCASGHRTPGRRTPSTFRQAFLRLLVAPMALSALAACFLVFAPGTAAAPGESSENAPVVWATKATGIIDPPLAGFLVKTMEDAAAAGAA